jgi:hypothetical protein
MVKKSHHETVTDQKVNDCVLNDQERAIFDHGKKSSYDYPEISQMKYENLVEGSIEGTDCQDR